MVQPSGAISITNGHLLTSLILFIEIDRYSDKYMAHLKEQERKGKILAINAGNFITQLYHHLISLL